MPCEILCRAMTVVRYKVVNQRKDSMKNQSQKKGFTIIEVVLVLAIAGLIFLMVFVALPALQRSQRDTQRKDDMARLITAVQNYQSGNRNKSPIITNQGNASLAANFVGDYLTANGDTFADPSPGDTYTFEGVTICTSSKDGCPQGSTDDAMGVIHAYTNATCDGANPVYSQGNNKAAFTINLEGAGTYCTNN